MDRLSVRRQFRRRRSRFRDRASHVVVPESLGGCPVVGLIPKKTEKMDGPPRASQPGGVTARITD